MAARTILPLEAGIDIDAKPEAVWALVSDLRRMSRWSPEVIFQGFTSKQLRKGSRSINLNKRKAFIWPTSSHITDFEPNKKISFYVMGPAAQWTFELEATATGTRLVERRDLRRSKRSIASKVTASVALGGIESHDAELVAGMQATLAQIKAEVEAA